MKKRAILRFRAFRLFLKTSKYGSLAVFLAIIILGGLTVWAVVPREKIETLEAYPAKIISGGGEDSGNGSGWSNLNNVLGRPDVPPDGKIENFSNTNSAIYMAGSSSLIVSDFSAEGRDASGYYENKEFVSAKIKFSFATGEKKADLEIQDNKTGFLKKFKNLFAIQNAKADENKENFIDSTEDKIILASPENIPSSNDTGKLPNIDDKIIVWYSFDGEIWWKLDTLSGYSLSNASNNGYFSYDAPLVKNWDDLKNLKIKFEGVVGGETNTVTYVDSVWMEASYAEAQKEENKADVKNAKIEIVSPKKDFKRDEEPELKFHYQKKQGIIAAIGESLGINSNEEKIKTTAKITNPKGETEDVLPEEIIENNGDISVRLKKERGFKPGLYKVTLELDDQGVKKEITQDFTWGVLAINTNKSIYLPNEQAYLQMAALKDDGHTVCDANLVLSIKYQVSGAEKIFSTEDGTIERSGKCSGDNVTDVPDYFVHYKVGEVGNYQMTLTRVDPATNEKINEITDSFEVRDTVPFEVERIGPTRIYPPADYEMTLKIKANRDFSGEIIEMVPEGFEIKYQAASIKYQGKNNFEELNTEYEILNTGNSEKSLVWQNISLKNEDEMKISYSFDAPDISPYVYLLGPLGFQDSGGSLIFREARQWQIAADAVPVYRSSGTFTAGTSTITPPYPADMAANDICLLVVESENQTISLSAAQGFAEVLNSPQSAGTAASDPANRIAVYWKRTVGGDTAPTVAASGNHNTARIHCFTGVITSGNPWDVTAGGNDSGANDLTGVIPGATTTVGNTLVILIQGSSYNGNNTAQCSAWTNADLANITERSDNTNTAGLGGGHCMATGEKASIGAYANTTVTIAQTTYKGAMSIALKPPALTISGTSNAAGGTVKLAINGTLQSQTGTISGGTWTISNATMPAAGAIITTWIDAVADSAESTAVAKYNGAATVSGMVLNTNVLSLGSSENQSLSVTDLNNYTCTQNEDVMHSAASSTLAVQGCTNSYTAPDINVLAGNTLTVAGTETLTAYDLDINGTLTSGGNSAYNISHNWTNNGAFTQSTSTVTLNGTTAQAIAGSVTTAFNNLTDSNTTAAVSGSVNFNVAGTFNMNGANTLFTPAAAVMVNSSAQGTITGTGTVQVTRTAATADYSMQYMFTTNTLTNLTVDYNGTGEVLSNLTYGNLKISGSITGASNAATVGGTFTNTGTFTPTSGTITMNNGSSIVYTSGTLTFSGLTVADSAAVTSTGSFAVAGTFTVGPTAAATFTPDAAGVISGAGTLTGYGTVQVTRTAATADFSSQYTITNKTLANLTVEYAGAGAQTVSSITYGHLKINMAGQVATLGGAITVNGNFTIAAGTLDTGNGLNYGIIVKGNWVNSGTFTARLGTVAFSGAGGSTQDISGNTTFYDFTATTTLARILRFAASSAQTVSHNWTITGAAAQLITLTTSSSPTQWTVNPVAASVSYADVNYSNNTGASFCATYSQSTSGNNTNWSIGSGAVCGITISGNAYADEGTTVWAGCGANPRISLVVNGGAEQTTVCNSGTGAYSFTGVTVAANNPVSVYFNTNTGNTDKGAAVTVAANSTSAITLNPRKNIVWVKTEGAVANITNANLDHCDSASPAQCANVPYTVTTSNLTVAASTELYIESAKTFAPGGTVTTAASSIPANVDGDIHIMGTFSAGANAVSVGGDWNNAGTFSKSAGQITTFTATAAGFTITPGTGNFDSVVFNGVGGGWSGSAALALDANLTMTNGTLSGTQNLTVSGGNITCGATCGTINLTGGTATLGGAGDFGTNSLASNWTFNSLTFGAGSISATTSKGTGTITIANTLTIAANQTLDAGFKIWVLSNFGTPFSISGVFTPSSSTFRYAYNGASTTNITAATYNNLELKPAGAGANSYVLGTAISQTITANGYLTAGEGTNAVSVTAVTYNPALSIAGNFTNSANAAFIASGSASFTVGGFWTNSGTFTHSSGTVTFGSGWSYKKTLVLSGVDLTDYQVKFTVYQGNGIDDNATNTVYCNGKCRVAAAGPNGYGDIRFTDANGNQLSYWIEDSAASPAIIWVKVPTIAIGGTTVYMLYGNSTATAASNGANTFDMFLDFENTVEGYSAGSSSTTQKKFGSYSYQLGSGGTKTVSVPSVYSLIQWFYPTSTSADGTLQYRHDASGYAYLGKGYIAGEWSYYEGLWKDTGLAIAPNGWVKSELRFNATTYDILFNDTVYKTGVSYVSGDLQYILSSASMYVDGQLIRQYAASEPTKAWGSETTRTITDGGSPFYNITFNDSGSGAIWLYQDGASTAPNQTTVQNGTPTYLNAKTGTVSVTGGALNVDWYLGVHAVDAANTAADIQTAANAITVSENSGTPSSTVWRNDGATWGAAAASQTTDTAATGKNPQPNSAGAIRIREYSKTSIAATYYLYNLQISWQGNYGPYDYYSDYGGNYLTSSANPAAGNKTISVSWYRSTAGSMNGVKPYDGVNNSPTQGSWYAGTMNGLTFSIDSFSVNLGTLTPGAAPVDGTNTLTVTTSATNGYVVTVWSAAAMTCSDTGACGTAAIADWTGTNGTPAAWSAGSYGFGYSTNDITLTGGTASRFSGPAFAGFVHSGAGDPVADRSGTECPCNGQTNTITYRIAAGSTQRPGPYSATIIYVLTAQY